MASIKHSTPKVSAYSIYTRNKKLNDVSERKVVHSKPVTEAKTDNSNLDIKKPSLRKRKGNITVNLNETATEEQVVKKKRGRKKKIVQEETPDVEDSHSDVELQSDGIENESEEADEDVALVNENVNLKTSPIANGSFSRKQTAACGNKTAEDVFQWLLNPIKPEVFFEKKWEKKPFFIKRSNRNYYQGLYSTRDFEKTVKENYLNYDREIDVVAYVDGQRKPLIPESRVFTANLWNNFQEGYSVRMRNPQVYHLPLGKLCSLLQEYFSSYVGANMYLTPADSQGFPPHFDDIDAFILQIEGKKQWKLYTPSEGEMLTRYSSPDLTEDQIGEPCMNVELNPGDMLYFPRGYIHQANTVPGEHSMHITLSTNQLNTWGDLLKHALTNAIELATEKDIEFRKSIPKDYLDYMGSIHCGYDSKERKDFEKKAFSLIEKSLEYISLDRAADAQAVDFMHGSMPPYLNDREKACSFYGNGACFIGGKAVVSEALSLKSKVRFIRRRAFRLHVDEEGAKLYNTLNNSLNHKEREVSYVEVDPVIVPALTTLFKTYPDYIKIKDLPLGSSQKLLHNIQLLYDNGFLMTEEPLPFEE